MRTARYMLVACLLLTLTGCATLNVGAALPVRPRIVSLSLSDTSVVSGQAIKLSVEYTNLDDLQPITWTATFSDCVTPAIHVFTSPVGTSSASLTFVTEFFLLVDDPGGKDCTVAVTAVDAVGHHTGPQMLSFHVYGIPGGQVDIVSAIASRTEVDVTVADSDNSNVLITFIAPAGISGTPTSAVVPGGNGIAHFSFTGIDIFAGGTVDITFTADDSRGSTDTATATITADPINLVADTLYAIPLDTDIFAGERVRIVVATGDPANPFQYMTGVRVTVDQAADALYVGAGGTGDVPGSFNVGLPGGQTGDVDGFWTAMNPSGFLLAPDSFIQRSDAGGGPHCFDFNVTPLGGSDVADGEGALFNFELEFPNDGTYKLGFQDLNIVSRTYYQDGNMAPDYFWGDISNDHEGVPNTVTVH
ncbi:MAG: hypothetical protein M3R04_02225 [bacterium]|nr:hypothetical protein [bacterium]